MTPQTTITNTHDSIILRTTDGSLWFSILYCAEAHFKGHEIFVLWSLSDGEIPRLYWISGSIRGDRRRIMDHENFQDQRKGFTRQRESEQNYPYEFIECLPQMRCTLLLFDAYLNIHVRSLKECTIQAEMKSAKLFAYNRSCNIQVKYLGNMCR